MKRDERGVRRAEVLDQELREMRAKCQQMARLLDACREYFLNTEAGNFSPFVKKIDELIPRK